jgi:hypothetical protein
MIVLAEFQAQTALPMYLEVDIGGRGSLVKVSASTDADDAWFNTYLRWQTCVRFASSYAHVGDLVNVSVTVTSCFPGPIHFSHMAVHFTDDIIVQHFEDNTPVDERLRNMGAIGVFGSLH